MATTGKPQQALKTMAHLQKATEHWSAFKTAVEGHAKDSADERARADREQTDDTEWHRATEAKTGA